MSDEKRYEELFTNYAEKVRGRIIFQGTIGEVDFIEKEINHVNCKILDIGCGTGRQAIELTRRGYTVTEVSFREDIGEST